MRLVSAKFCALVLALRSQSPSAAAPLLDAEWRSVRPGAPSRRGHPAQMRKVGVATGCNDAGARVARPRVRLGGTSKAALLCLLYVCLSASGPILLDWVKHQHGGRFRFSIPALTFHAWAVASLLGLSWAASQGTEGLRKLYRPDMLWRFGITTSLFTAGDMLSFLSLQHLDVGTFSLVGKALAIIITVLLTRALLRRRQTQLQWTLVALTAASVAVFCFEERSAQNLHRGVALAKMPTRSWLAGLTQRTMAVFLTSLGGVLQERLVTRDRSMHFLLQQCWMGSGAMALSFCTMRFVYGLPAAHLFYGFGDWRVLLLLAMYVANGLTTGLIVRQLGAVTKALCVPVYLGGCYAYAVHTGSALLTPLAVLAWVVSTTCVLFYAATAALAKARAFSRKERDRPEPSEAL